MKKLVIVGHGTGGTIIATKMRQKLPERVGDHRPVGPFGLL